MIALGKGSVQVLEAHCSGPGIRDQVHRCFELGCGDGDGRAVLVQDTVGGG